MQFIPHKSTILLNMNRRTFLETAGILGTGGWAMLYGIRVNAEPLPSNAILFRDLIFQSNNYEPSRTYPFLTAIATPSNEYWLDGLGFVGHIDEKDIVPQFANTVVTNTALLFSNTEGTHKSKYFVAQKENIDPKFYGNQPPVHFGIDLVTCDSVEKNDTIFHNPIRTKFMGYISNIGRLSEDTLITQVVDNKDKNLTISIDGVKCGVVILYGHLLPINRFNPNDILEAGSVLGDITKFSKLGGSSGPHVHIEMIAIPQTKLDQINGDDITIQQILLKDEYDPLVENIYLDSDFIWKFLPGKTQDTTGINPELWKITSSYKSKMEHYHG